MGGALVIAFMASALFQRAHVPDILFLLGTGALLGPVLGVVGPGVAHAVLPILSALAIITIVFDGALEVTPAHLRSFGIPAVGLSLTVATTTAVLCAIVAHFVQGMPWSSAGLLGLCFGGAGIAIIVPLAQRMRVSHDAMAIILLEAVTSDILVIVGMGIACTAVAVGGVNAALAARFAGVIGFAFLVGPAAGWAWSRFLGRWGHATNAYMATLAVLVLAYAGSEALGGSGALAVLLFGITVGNARGRPLGSGLRNRVFGRELLAFHHEVVFFVRAAFFVGVGAVTRWDLLRDRGFLLAGLLLALSVAACRSLGVAAVLGRSGLSGWDRAATALLFPMGLATAAVSVIPRAFGIPFADRIVDLAAVVIVLTNVLGTLAVFFGSRLRPAPPPVPVPLDLAD
jgi:cell volume regulation protein A